MKPGDKLTIEHAIILHSGKIAFSKEDKVTVSEVIKEGGYYGKICGYFIPERILGVKLKGYEGIWFTSCFQDLNETGKPQPETSIQHPESSIQHPASSNQHQVSSK